MKSDKQRLS